MSSSNVFIRTTDTIFGLSPGSLNYVSSEQQTLSYHISEIYNKILSSYDMNVILRPNSEEKAQMESCPLKHESTRIDFIRNAFAQKPYSCMSPMFFESGYYGPVRHLEKRTREAELYDKDLPTMEMLNHKSNIFNLLPTVNIMHERPAELKGENGIERFITKYSSKLYAIFTMTKYNLVFATLCQDGTPTFNSYIIAMLKQEEDVDILREFSVAVGKIFDYSSKIVDSFINKTEDTIIQDEMIRHLLISIKRKLLSTKSNVTLDMIIETVNRSVNSIMPNNTDMYSEAFSYQIMNRNRLYKTTILRMMEQVKNAERSAFKKGIVTGSKFYTAFERAGYIYHINKKLWEKDVKITPAVCIYNNVTYKLDDEMIGKYFVKKLVFNPSDILGNNFILRADAYHPNIHGKSSESSSVCIGTVLGTEYHRLIQDLESYVEEYYNFLLKVEDALHVINFDSSYWKLGQDFSDKEVTRLKRYELGHLPKSPESEARVTLRKV